MKVCSISLISLCLVDIISNNSYLCCGLASAVILCMPTFFNTKNLSACFVGTFDTCGGQSNAQNENKIDTVVRVFHA